MFHQSTKDSSKKKVLKKLLMILNQIRIHKKEHNCLMEQFLDLDI